MTRDLISWAKNNEKLAAPWSISSYQHQSSINVRMLSILRKARLKDKEMRILML